MIGAIISKEFTEYRRDRRLLLLAGLVAMLTALAVWAGAAGQSRYYTDRAAATAADHAVWNDQGAINPHSAAHFGQYAFRPRMPLGILDPGLSPYLGQAVWMEAHFQDPAQGRPAEGTVALQRFGDLSPAWLLTALLPLLLIVCGFATVAGERERGALKLQMVQGARALPLLAGKALGLFLVAAIVAVPLLIIGLVASTAIDADTTQRWLGMVIAYLAYLGSWSIAIVILSSWSASARTALVMLLAIWAGSVVLVPRLAAEHAVAAHPDTSAGTFWQAVQQAKQNGFAGRSSEDAEIKAVMSRLMRRYGVDSPEALPVDAAGVALQASEEHGAAVFDRLYGRVAAQERAQLAVQRDYALLSPAIALRAVSAGLAGNDLAHQQAFTQAAESHRRRLDRLLNAQQIAHGKGANFANTVDADFLRVVPRFSERSPTIALVWQAHAADAAILIVWLAALTGLLVLSARRFNKGVSA